MPASLFQLGAFAPVDKVHNTRGTKPGEFLVICNIFQGGLKADVESYDSEENAQKRGEAAISGADPPDARPLKSFTKISIKVVQNMTTKFGKLLQAEDAEEGDEADPYVGRTFRDVSVPTFDEDGAFRSLTICDIKVTKISGNYYMNLLPGTGPDDHRRVWTTAAYQTLVVGYVSGHH